MIFKALEYPEHQDSYYSVPAHMYVADSVPPLFKRTTTSFFTTTPLAVVAQNVTVKYKIKLTHLQRNATRTVRNIVRALSRAPFGLRRRF